MLMMVLLEMKPLQSHELASSMVTRNEASRYKSLNLNLKLMGFCAGRTADDTQRAQPQHVHNK